jgi:hypothetical protein
VVGVILVVRCGAIKLIDLRPDWSRFENWALRGQSKFRKGGPAAILTKTSPQPVVAALTPPAVLALPQARVRGTHPHICVDLDWLAIFREDARSRQPVALAANWTFARLPGEAVQRLAKSGRLVRVG